jgi:hypothetical protein
MPNEFCRNWQPLYFIHVRDWTTQIGVVMETLCSTREQHNTRNHNNQCTQVTNTRSI